MEYKTIFWILLIIWLVGYTNLYYKEKRYLNRRIKGELDSEDEIEGFTNQVDECKKAGYTNEYCQNLAHPSQCITDDGIIGKRSRLFPTKCTVNEEIEETILGLGKSNLDPSIIKIDTNKEVIPERIDLKWRDNTELNDIDIGVRHGYNAYQEGLLEKTNGKVSAYNSNVGIWNKYFSKI